MHRDARAPCVGLQYGLPLGSSARWTYNLPSDLPANLLLSANDGKVIVLMVVK